MCPTDSTNNDNLVNADLFPCSSSLLTSDLSLYSPGDDLMRCVDLYNQTQCKWFEEMVTTSMVRAD